MAAIADSLSVIFHPRPDVVFVTIQRQYEIYNSRNRLEIETLINRLASGPIFCCGNIGPESYDGRPLLLRDRIGEQKLYGWRSGTPRNWKITHPIIILGARKMENGDHDVLFTPSYRLLSDLGLHNNIRKAQSSYVDQKVYRTRLQNFCNHDLQLYFAPTQAELGQARVTNKVPAGDDKKEDEIRPNSQEQLPLLSEMERKFVDELMAIPQSSFLGGHGYLGGNGIETANELGQEMFKYFSAIDPNPIRVWDNITKIFHCIESKGPDGIKQMEYLRLAYKQLGHGPYDIKLEPLISLFISN